jgi:PadR family transcriptional regulator, regulatory protein PadR
MGSTCEPAGYGTGTIYPELDRLMRAMGYRPLGEPASCGPSPARRFYEMTSTGREQYAAGLQARRERRAAWLRPVPHIGGGK